MGTAIHTVNVNDYVAGTSEWETHRPFRWRVQHFQIVKCHLP
jgi:hypothetical protein